MLQAEIFSAILCCPYLCDCIIKTKKQHFIRDILPFRCAAFIGLYFLFHANLTTLTRRFAPYEIPDLAGAAIYLIILYYFYFKKMYKCVILLMYVKMSRLDERQDYRYGICKDLFGSFGMCSADGNRLVLHKKTC